MTPLTHPERVASAVPGHCKLVALLHDAVEDGHISQDDLDGGVEYTEGWAIDILPRKPEQTYAQYIDGIATAGNDEAARMARTVKIADLRDNLHGRPEGPPPDSLRQRYERALAILEAVDAP